MAVMLAAADAHQGSPTPPLTASAPELEQAVQHYYRGAAAARCGLGAIPIDLPVAGR